MREIKFRIWSKIENEYAYMKIEKEIPVFVSKSRKTVLSAYWLFKKNNKLVVEQYVGIKDIHGVEIYEGDEISQKPLGYLEPVIYEQGVVTINPTQGVKVGARTLNLYYEVIGNIHER